ncbi:MAG: glycosyltransferase [Alphaproteobacteria bacterium]|nr:MAG: glycosyltransferase [Alphaproteobacteria bacterium]
MMIALLVLVLLPAVLTVINLLVLRRLGMAGDGQPISVLIPARDEAATIGACLDAILANHGVVFEVVVLDDHSSDATAAIVEAYAARDGRVRLERAPALPPGWSGKQHACQVLAGHARFDHLVFLDADVRLAPTALVRLSSALTRADLVSGVPQQITQSLAERAVIPQILVLLLGYLPMPFMQLFWRSPAFAAGCGQVMAVTRIGYRAAGGHRAIATSLHDGVQLPRAFRRAGRKTALVDATDLASCRMYHGARAVHQGFLKNAHEGMASPRALPVWTVLLAGGHLLPWLVLPWLAVAGDPLPLSLALAGQIAARGMIAWRFRQGWRAVLLHPIGVAWVLVIQWHALIRRLAGRAPVWRGRAYAGG